MLKISVRTMENTTIACISGFWGRLAFFSFIFFFWGGGVIFFVWICCFLVIWFWLVGLWAFFFFLNTKECLLISLWSCKQYVYILFYHFLQSSAHYSRHCTKMYNFILLKFYVSPSSKYRRIKTGNNYIFYAPSPQFHKTPDDSNTLASKRFLPTYL